MQNTEEVGYNSRVKLTTSKYYIPSRRCIQAVKYENGQPVDIPDSERSKFKTANGRTVLDGGGVTPDVKLPAKEHSEFTQALIKDKMIFHYVNKYTSGVDSIEAPGEFEFSDYSDFKSFVTSSDFKFESELESKIASLKKESDSGLSGEFDQLLAKLNSMQTSLLDEYEEEITKEIEIQIVTRYYFQSGKAKQRLNGDSEIQEAIALLNDTPRYNKILGK